MTKHSKYHLIIVLLTFGLLGILKGQGNGTYQMPIGRFDEKKVDPILIQEMSSHRNALLGKVEIIPYRIVPSDHPLYGCWSELEVMWPPLMKEEYREMLTITIVNQELHNDIPTYVELGGVSYYVLKLPIGQYDRRDYKDWDYERY